MKNTLDDHRQITQTITNLIFRQEFKIRTKIKLRKYIEILATVGLQLLSYIIYNITNISFYSFTTNRRSQGFLYRKCNRF